jgi:hypothetical protein
MVSTPELTVVVSDDTVGPSLFLFFFFFASAVWVAAIVATAQDADILPVVCRVRRGTEVATFGGALVVVGSSSSLPTDESEMYSSTLLRRDLHVPRITDLEAYVLLFAQRSRAPVDAFTKLQINKKKRRPTSKLHKL